jgi:hypothetical protein
MTAYSWVQNDHETVETDLTALDGAPPHPDLEDRTVHFILRHYDGAKVADKQASVSGTTAMVELTPKNLSRPSSHEAEWVITDGPDDPTTLPKGEPIEIDVRPSVDDDDDVAAPLPEDETVDVLTANGLNGSITGSSRLTSLVNANLAVNADDSLFVPDSAVLSAIDGGSITPQALALGNESVISGYAGALSVDSNDNLVATDTDTSDHDQLTNVQSDQHHSRTTSDDLESGGSDTLNVDGLPGDLADAQAPKSHDHTGDTLTPDTVDTESLSSTSADTEQLSVTKGGSVQLGMVGTRHSVPSGGSVTVPDGYSEVVVGPYDLNGELTVDGRMEIL